MFSWSKQSSPTPPHVVLIPRNEHLFSYLNHSVLKPSTRKVSTDDTMYDTVFQTTNGFALILRIYVPADNKKAPQMTLHGVIASHSWLDIRMRVIGYAPISSDQSWRYSKLKLGDAVYAVIHHFQLQPPSISQIVDENLSRLQQTLSGTSMNNATIKSNPPTTTSPSNIAHKSNGIAVQAKAIDKKEAACKVDEDELSSLIPRVPSSFTEIDEMSLSELSDLVNNKTTLDTFINKIPVVEALKELKESIENANVDTAMANLALEEKVESICSEVETLKQDLKSNIEKYNKLDARRAAMTRPPEIHEAVRELTAAKKKALHESDEFADDWVESGGSDVTAFVKKFMDTRVLHHMRAAKAERLKMSTV
ncbi:hypothetical protein ACHAWT_005849 [Skeletonema menzelii]